MNMETSNKETIIDRYLAAVSERLPVKQREDTVKEISSLIQDALDDRSKTEGKEPDDEMMIAVLKEFGPPEKIIAPYLPERYLIGPYLYPTFMLVLRIALPIIGVLTLVAFWLGLNFPTPVTGAGFITELVKSVGQAIASVVTAFGNIVLIFAILQWAIPEFRTAPKAKEWDPRSLKAISQPDKVKRGELIVEIFFILVALIVFNIYLDRVGIYNNLNGVWSFTPILTSTFISFIPWLDLLWVATIVLDIVLLRKGAWQAGTRIFSILVNALNIGIAATLMSRVPYLYTLQGAMGQFGGAGIVNSFLNQVLIIVFVVVIISSAVKIIQMLLRLLRARVPALENITR
jgi:HAAS